MTNWSDREIDIDAIDCTDRSLAVTTTRSIEALSCHIDRIGLLAPPILRNENRHYRIVAGFRRIEACRMLQWQRIPARVIDASESVCAEIAIADNTGHRTLNWIETARAYNLLRQHCSDDTALLDRARSLGLAAGPDILRKTAALLALPQQLQRWVEDDVLPMPMALELGRIHPAEDAVALGELFWKLKLGLNRQRELLAYLSDIARRDRRTIGDILKDPEVTTILEDPTTDTPIKTNLLRRHLRRKRYPRISAFEDRYHRNVQELRLPKGVNLVPPEHFEGPVWRMEIHFEKPDDFRKKIESLQDILKNPVFWNLLT
ncbi:MAG: ParB N-terminal domain-containing protein [Thermodesulfobacteriota bacterium]